MDNVKYIRSRKDKSEGRSAPPAYLSLGKGFFNLEKKKKTNQIGVLSSGPQKCLIGFNILYLISIIIQKFF